MFARRLAKQSVHLSSPFGKHRSVRVSYVMHDALLHRARAMASFCVLAAWQFAHIAVQFAMVSGPPSQRGIV